MKLNSETQIIGFQTILVPYRKSHVEKYHTWMESEKLREQTASERLTLEEEYKMQQDWLYDEQKCTFIVLDKETTKTGNEVESMIGDANLYLRRDSDNQSLIGEIGLMIADLRFRGSGRGREAALHMLRYGIEYIGVKKFIAVISIENKKSINMFFKLMFAKENENLVFQEVTFGRTVTEEWTQWVVENTPNYMIAATEPNH